VAKAAKVRRLLNKHISVAGIDVWSGETHAAVERLDYYFSLLSAAERGKSERYANALLRARYIDARGQLRCLLAQYCNCSPEALQFAAAAHGKPYLPDYPGVAFNISNSLDRLAVAVGSDCQVGIDIEVRRQRMNLSALVRRCFAAGERRYWESLPEEEQLAAFFALWTQKEAFVKAVGRGLGLGLEHCVFATQGENRLLAVPAGCGAAADWRVVTLDLGEAVSGALVFDL
jgi:4'-phosphopantetheinyl transferase